MNLHKFSNGLSAFAIGGLALLAAFHTGRYVERQADAARGNSPYDGAEMVSFNDGTQSPCLVIELRRDVTRNDVADALQAGADGVGATGCVNFAFVE